MLSNLEPARAYDASGKDGMEDVGFMDSGAFFHMIFGSEQFEPLVGTLKLASMAQQGDDEMPPDEAEWRQRAREVACARNLVELCAPYVDAASTPKAFAEIVRARRLSSRRPRSARRCSTSSATCTTWRASSTSGG